MLAFLIFLIIFVSLTITAQTINPTLFRLFMFIAMLSFFTEDTLETQAGVTFVAFFMSLFLVGAKDLNKRSSTSIEN